MFKIEAPIEESELATEVYGIFKQLKFLNRSSGSPRPTGLTFDRDKIHGRVWKLPENPLGRMVADIIDAKLFDLAERIEEEQGRPR